MRGPKDHAHATGRRRPSPYELLALGAAALALSGVAYAAIPSADGTIKGCYAAKNGLILGIPYSKGDVRVVDEGASCRSYEQQLTWNQKGKPGEPGQPGEPGSAAAYAFVASDGSVDPERSKNVDAANVVHPEPGVYCVKDLAFTPRSAVITAAAGGGDPTMASASVAPPGGSIACPGHIAQIVMKTYFVGSSDPSSHEFTIWIED